jgi:hypothetical protein
MAAASGADILAIRSPTPSLRRLKGPAPTIPHPRRALPVLTLIGVPRVGPGTALTSSPLAARQHFPRRPEGRRGLSRLVRFTPQTALALILPSTRRVPVPGAIDQPRRCRVAANSDGRPAVVERWEGRFSGQASKTGPRVACISTWAAANQGREAAAGRDQTGDPASSWAGQEALEGRGAPSSQVVGRSKFPHLERSRFRTFASSATRPQAARQPRRRAPSWPFLPEVPCVGSAPAGRSGAVTGLRGAGRPTPSLWWRASSRPARDSEPTNCSPLSDGGRGGAILRS